MAHPAIVTLEMYKARLGVNEKRYEKFLSMSRRDETIFDLIDTIENLFPGQSLGLWFQVCEDINTAHSKKILQAVKDEIYIYYGEWSNSINRLIARNKWTLIDKEKIKRYYETFQEQA